MAWRVWYKQWRKTTCNGDYYTNPTNNERPTINKSPRKTRRIQIGTNNIIRVEGNIIKESVFEKEAINEQMVVIVCKALLFLMNIIIIEELKTSNDNNTDAVENVLQMLISAFPWYSLLDPLFLVIVHIPTSAFAILDFTSIQWLPQMLIPKHTAEASDNTISVAIL